MSFKGYLMKKIISIILTTVLSTSLFGLDIFSYVPVVGNVKNYTQVDYNITSKFGSYYRTPVGKTIHTLNVSGKEIETTELSAKDTVIGKTVATYDIYGNLTGETSYSSDDIVLWNTVIKYDQNKRPVDLSEFGKNKQLKDKIIYTYNDQGLKSEETGYDSEGALIWKVVYKYTDDKKLEVMTEYDEDGIFCSQNKYTYKPNGKVESIVIKDAFTNTEQILVFRYASNDQLTEVTTFGDLSKTNIIKRVLIKYDTLGNVAKISEYNVAPKFGTIVNELVSVTEYTYTY